MRRHFVLAVGFIAGMLVSAWAIDLIAQGAIANTTGTSRLRGSVYALSVELVDGSGAQVTSFGGGTQYTEGDTDATITGTAVMWEDAGNTLSAVSASSPLPVSVISTAEGTLAEFPAAALLANNASVPTTTMVGAVCMVYDGATIDFCTNSDVAEDAAETAGVSGPMVLGVRRDTAASSAGTSGDNATFNTDSLGRMWVRNGGPCQDHARVTTAPITTAASGNVEIVALNGSDLIYICGYEFTSTTAQGVQWIYGTGTACATGETDISGVMEIGATGGIAKTNTGYPQIVVPAGNAFCVEKDDTVQMSGYVTYVRTAAP